MFDRRGVKVAEDTEDAVAFAVDSWHVLIDKLFRVQDELERACTSPRLADDFSDTLLDLSDICARMSLLAHDSGLFMFGLDGQERDRWRTGDASFDDACETLWRGLEDKLLEARSLCTSSPDQAFSCVRDLTYVARLVSDSDEMLYCAAAMLFTEGAAAPRYAPDGDGRLVTEVPVLDTSASYLHEDTLALALDDLCHETLRHTDETRDSLLLRDVCAYAARRFGIDCGGWEVSAPSVDAFMGAVHEERPLFPDMLRDAMSFVVDTRRASILSERFSALTRECDGVLLPDVSDVAHVVALVSGDEEFAEELVEGALVPFAERDLDVVRTYTEASVVHARAVDVVNRLQTGAASAQSQALFEDANDLVRALWRTALSDASEYAGHRKPGLHTVYGLLDAARDLCAPDFVYDAIDHLCEVSYDENKVANALRVLPSTELWDASFADPVDRLLRDADGMERLERSARAIAAWSDGSVARHDATVNPRIFPGLSHGSSTSWFKGGEAAWFDHVAAERPFLREEKDRYLAYVAERGMGRVNQVDFDDCMEYAERAMQQRQGGIPVAIDDAAYANQMMLRAWRHVDARVAASGSVGSTTLNEALASTWVAAVEQCRQGSRFVSHEDLSRLERLACELGVRTDEQGDWNDDARRDLVRAFDELRRVCDESGNESTPASEWAWDAFRMCVRATAASCVDCDSLRGSLRYGSDCREIAGRILSGAWTPASNEPLGILPSTPFPRRLSVRSVDDEALLASHDEQDCFSV